MKCRHGNTGICPLCRADEARGEIILETARIVVQLADNYGLDTSRLEHLLRALR